MPENQLSNYHNRELKDSIRSLTVVSGTAKDSGNLYYCIEITFINGFQKRIFLRNDETFAWCNAFDMLKTTQQLDNDSIEF